jgi:hypothetical protein
MRYWDRKLRIYKGGQTMRRILQVLLVVIVTSVGGAFSSAAPPKDKDDAPDVVIGIVQKLTTSEDKYDDGRVVTKHTALVKVQVVQKATPDSSRVVKVGDTITVRWSQVTRPSGSTGYTYDVREKESIRAYLMRQCGCEGFCTIDNATAIENLDRPEK